MAEPMARGPVVSSLLQAAQAAGLTPASLFEDSELLRPTSPGQDYPVAALRRLYRRVELLSGDADIALNVGRIMYLQGLNMQLYMTTICRTFREYLNLIPNTAQLVGQLGQVLVQPEGEFIRLEWHPQQGDTAAERYFSDQLLSSSAMIVNSICARPVAVRAAHFSYPRPESTAALEQVFGSELEFDAPLSCLYLARQSLSLPLVQLDFELGSEFAAAPRALVAGNHTGDPFLDSLREPLRRALPSGSASIDRVASDMGISRRTLQRRLNEQQTNFKQVLQSLREQMAESYLRDSRLSITEIGFLLGYSDQASFSNAFRLWQGCSPSEYRQRL